MRYLGTRRKEDHVAWNAVPGALALLLIAASPAVAQAWKDRPVPPLPIPHVAPTDAHGETKLPPMPRPRPKPTVTLTAPATPQNALLPIYD